MRVTLFDNSTALGLAAVLAFSLPLQGCSNPNGFLMGARAQLSSPVKGGVYLPVGSTPPPREQPAMTENEQARLRNELTTLRSRQALAVKARDRNAYLARKRQN